MYELQYQQDILREPWLISTEKRFQMLRNARKKEKKVALLIYEAPDTSTFRYRGYNVMRATEKSEQWLCMYFFLDQEFELILKLIKEVDIVTFIRVHWKHELDLILSNARSARKKVVFDVDDLIFDVDYVPLVTNTLNVHFGSARDYEFWFGDIARIGFMASKADVFISTNKFLARMLESKFKKSCYLIQNSLNDEQLMVSHQCVMNKKCERSRSPFVIGYFSGTPSHVNDFKVIYREMMQLLYDFPDMRLDVVGFMEFPAQMQPLIADGRVTFTPLVDFVELQRLISQVDVNIVPLVRNTFTNCKSELKFFEAAIVNTVTVATPTYTYSSAITHGLNGFLCNPGEWYKTIRDIYEGCVNIEEIVKNANAFAVNHYYGENFIRQIESTYNSIYEAEV